MGYPEDPGFQAHSETSRIAADTLVDVDGQLADVAAAFKEAGPHGATCDEITLKLRAHDRPKIENGTVSARMVKLKNDGIIYLKGERRITSRNKPAEVWVHIDHGNLQHVQFTLESLSSKRNLKRDILGQVAEFLEQAVRDNAFAIPLLYEKRATELAQKTRQIMKELSK